MTVYYGEHPLPMTYSDEALDEKIESFISEQKKAGHAQFSYKSLCYALFRIAQSENCLKVESDASYNNPVMDETDATRISRLLWERIWERKIFIDFHENKYVAHYHDDIRFCVL